MNKTFKNWYSDWFNSDFYHILYKDRDAYEAQLFMQNLTSYLKLSKGSTILDLACGKGRHAIYLNSIGYDVTGVDLSENSISQAKKFENETLHFKVHDMRKAFDKKFDAVFNLFTSFGYFEDENDNFLTIKAIKENLNETGVGVIDFMNVNYVKQHLIPEEKKTVEHIDFCIKRQIENEYVIKEIEFTTNDETHHFMERVKALTFKDFKTYFKKADVTLLHTFGDYNLQKFDEKTSERLILIFK